jgi:hypothetical protein
MLQLITYLINNNKIALMKIHQRQIICVGDWTRRPPRGPRPQGFTYTLSQTHTHTYTSFARTHTQDNSHSLPFQAKPTPLSLPYLFLSSTLLTSTRLQPNRLPIAIIYSIQEPPQIITNMPSHTTSLPSPRLSPIHSLHHLDLHLLTTNITHITQKSTNTTQQQQIVM